MEYLFLYQLEQHAARTCRVNKHVGVPAGSLSRFVQETRASVLQAFRRPREIIDAQRQMMKARSTRIDKLCDGGTLIRCLNQFDSGGTGGRSSRKHGHVDPLSFYRLSTAYSHSEHAAVELQCFVQAANGDAEMVNFYAHAVPVIFACKAAIAA
jgi:hypothetical protein